MNKKYALERLSINAKTKRTHLDPANINEPLSVGEMLDIVHVLNNLTDDIEKFKDKINSKLTKVAHSKRSIVGTMLLRHLFLFSFVWQVVNVSVVTFAYPKKGQSELSREEQNVVIGVMAAFQTIHLGLVFFTSIRLCKKVLHKKAAPLFVAQSFLSTLLMFAGMYSLLQCISPDCFQGINKDDIHTVLAIRFIYFSTATMTTAGYGDVVPHSWAAQILVICQMLVALTYTVIIFTQGLAHFNTPYILRKKQNGADDMIDEAHQSLLYNS